MEKYEFNEEMLSSFIEPLSLTNYTNKSDDETYFFTDVLLVAKGLKCMS